MLDYLVVYDSETGNTKKIATEKNLMISMGQDFTEKSNDFKGLEKT